MSFMKRACYYTFIILLLISIYKDLTIVSPSKHYKSKSEYTQIYVENNHFTIVKIKVVDGETILSITEQLNDGQLSNMNIMQIINDFKSINNFADPYNLLVNTNYYFPLYN